MSFSLSPAVTIREFDLSTVVPQVATTIAAHAGVYHWGAVGKRILIDSEDVLKTRVGKPSNLNAETWFTDASFLAYGDKLILSRAAVSNGASPTMNVTATANSIVMSTANTANLEVGMIMIHSGDTGVVTTGGKIASISNGTHFTLNSKNYIVANGSSSVQFVDGVSVYTALANTASVSNMAGQIILNDDDFTTKDGTFDANLLFAARYPGALGNSLRVSICDNADTFHTVVTFSEFVANGSITLTNAVGSNVATVVLRLNHDGSSANTARDAVNTAMYSLISNLPKTDLVKLGNLEIGHQVMKISGAATVTANATANSTIATATFTLPFEDELRLIDDVTETTSVERFWEFHDLINSEPGQSEYQRRFGNSAINDELHIVVIDELGKFSNAPGTILESYVGVSRATDAKTLDGATNYYRTVINTGSKYIWSTNDLEVGYSNTAAALTTMSTDLLTISFTNGQDGAGEDTIPVAALVNAYDLFSSGEEVDVSIIIQGKARGGAYGTTLANYLIDNIAEARKDCVVVVSPEKGDVVNQVGFEVDNIIQFRNNLRASSYGILDSGYKYMYDRYNDLYRWIPMNGDVAGLMVRTDQTNDPWWSPAGYNRGQIKNVVKLAFNPRKAQRDLLYMSDINPIVTFPGQGTILFGDKTLLGKPSAFDRINVRRLFIVMEKAIATAAKYFLFEFNDDFTRAQFRNMIIPYLREIQGKRGIYDFLFVCDATNNTPEVIDTNRLVGDIYIKPARSINFINLNFVAVRTGVAFTEVVGKFGG